jgi:hypothetical protein
MFSRLPRPVHSISILDINPDNLNMRNYFAVYDTFCYHHHQVKDFNTPPASIRLAIAETVSEFGHQISPTEKAR